MIIFHEGLPGSGKSYECLVKRVIPALQAGRHVVAYVEGLDAEKIAAAAELPVDKVRELLHPMTREQMVTTEEGKKGAKPKRVATWLDHARDNALHIFDEAQNFWPIKATLTDAETQFITEHRHRGIDVVLMGQDRRDVHATWRRRIDICAVFLKLSGIGLSSRYTVTTWRHLGQDSYERVGTQPGKYDPRYFGCYASHVSQDTNTSDYKDKRATVWGSALFVLGIPLALAAGGVGAWYAWRFFHPAPPPPKVAPAPIAGPAGYRPPPPAAAAAPAPPPPDLRSPQEKYVAGLSEKYRIRLAGIARSGERVTGYIEWMDGGSRVMERLSFDDMRQMGVALLIGERQIRLQLGTWQAIATSWPTEAEARVSENRLAAMKPAKDEPPMQTQPVSLGGTIRKTDPDLGPKPTEQPKR